MTQPHHASQPNAADTISPDVRPEHSESDALTRSTTTPPDHTQPPQPQSHSKPHSAIHIGAPDSNAETPPLPNENRDDLLAPYPQDAPQPWIPPSPGRLLSLGFELVAGLLISGGVAWGLMHLLRLPYLLCCILGIILGVTVNTLSVYRATKGERS